MPRLFLVFGALLSGVAFAQVSYDDVSGSCTAPVETGRTAEWPCTLVPLPEPEPTPDPGAFDDCQAYASGYFCQSMREVAGYTEYDTYQSGQFAGWTYYPTGECPPSQTGVAFDPVCSEPQPEPQPEPPPSEPPSAYRGIPDPSAALGFDVYASYVVDRTVTGPQGSTTLQGSGTASDPYVIDASGATFTKLNVTGSYVIVQGGKVNAPSGSGYWFNSNSCTRCVIRDVEVAGPGVDNNHSSAVGLGTFNVWLRGSIHGFGDNRQNAREQDFHGIKIESGTDIWILDAEIYDNSGDSVQCGDASRGVCQRVYMGGGYYHHNRENAVDIKDSRDVVVSGVRMSGFRPTGSSPGEAVIIHDDAYNARIYDNDISDSTLGIVSSGRSGHVIEGNNIQALSVGIQVRNTQDLTVTGNSIAAPTCVQRQSGVSGTVQTGCN